MSVPAPRLGGKAFPTSLTEHHVLNHAPFFLPWQAFHNKLILTMWLTGHQVPRPPRSKRRVVATTFHPLLLSSTSGTTPAASETVRLPLRRFDNAHGRVKEAYTTHLTGLPGPSKDLTRCGAASFQTAARGPRGWFPSCALGSWSR